MEAIVEKKEKKFLLSDEQINKYVMFLNSNPEKAFYYNRINSESKKPVSKKDFLSLFEFYVKFEKLIDQRLVIIPSDVRQYYKALWFFSSINKIMPDDVIVKEITRKMFFDGREYENRYDYKQFNCFDIVLDKSNLFGKFKFESIRNYLITSKQKTMIFIINPNSDLKLLDHYFGSITTLMY